MLTVCRHCVLEPILAQKFPFCWRPRALQVELLHFGERILQTSVLLLERPILSFENLFLVGGRFLILKAILLQLSNLVPVVVRI